MRHLRKIVFAATQESNLEKPWDRGQRNKRKSDNFNEKSCRWSGGWGEGSATGGGGSIFVTSMWPNYVQSWQQVRGIITTFRIQWGSGLGSGSGAQKAKCHRHKTRAGFPLLLPIHPGSPSLATISISMRLTAPVRHQLLHCDPLLHDFIARKSPAPSRATQISRRRQRGWWRCKDDDDNQRQTNKSMFKEGVYTGRKSCVLCGKAF